jgi:flagellar hook assembly protein FlgD
MERSIFPNPFRTSTTISFDLSNEPDEQIELEIFNIKGQKIRKLRIGNYKSGTNSIEWDGKDENGSPVSSGIYFYKLRSERYVSTKKLILMK